MSTRSNKNRPESPAPNSTPNTSQPKITLADIDVTLKMLTEQINLNQSMLDAKIDNSVAKLTNDNAVLSAKLGDVTSNVNNLINTKFATLQSDLRAEFSQRHDQHDEEITALKSTNNDLKMSCDAMSKRLDELSQQTAESAAANADLVDKLEFSEKVADIIVRGIPLVRNENCHIIFEKIALAIGYTNETTPPAAAFRIGVKKPGAKYDPPILLRFNNRMDKSEFFNKYLGKLSLNLADIGFTLSSRIYMSENLTMAKQKIFQAAMTLKREGKLVAVKTKLGAVLVQRTAKDSLTPIRRLTDL
jgi:hypothetical protein